MRQLSERAGEACSEDCGIGLLPQEPYDSVSNQRVKRELSHRVVAAWEPGDLARHSLSVKFIVRLLREFWKERKVVASGHHQASAIGAAKPLNKRIGTDRRPEKP